MTSLLHSAFDWEKNKGMINKQDECGRTPLMVAAELGLLNQVRLLLLYQFLLIVLIMILIYYIIFF